MPQVLGARKKVATEDKLLQGVCDIHIHRESMEDVLTLSRQAYALGYKGDYAEAELLAMR